MAMKNCFKIGIVVSLIVHIGFFALGGMVMNHLVNDVKERAAKAQSDMTYVDVQIADDDEDEASQSTDDIFYEEEESQSDAPDVQSDISVSKEDMSQAVPEQAQEPKADEVKKDAAGSGDNAKKDKKKLRRLSDVQGIAVREIEQSKFVIHDYTKKDSKDFNPTYNKRVQPEYDHSLIPAGEEIQVVIEFIMDDSGKVVQAYPVMRANPADVLPPDVVEDLDAAAIESLKQWDITPPKDEQSRRSPQQAYFNFTSDGVNFGAAANLY